MRDKSRVIARCDQPLEGLGKLNVLHLLELCLRQRFPRRDRLSNSTSREPRVKTAIHGSFLHETGCRMLSCWVGACGSPLRQKSARCEIAFHNLCIDCAQSDQRLEPKSRSRYAYL